MSKQLLALWGCKCNRHRLRPLLALSDCHRRRYSAEDFASRLGGSLPTLRKLERGAPCVVVATFVTALWLVGLLDCLRQLSRPESDVLGNMGPIIAPTCGGARSRPGRAFSPHAVQCTLRES